MFQSKYKTSRSLSFANGVLAGLRVVFLLVALTGVFLYTRAGAPEKVDAAASSTLNFQARLYTSNGHIVSDGTYNIEFKLYDSLGAGTSSQGSCVGGATDDCVWVETRTGANTVTVKNGYFSVNLGDLTAFPDINWDQDLYLTMNIGGTSGTPSWDGEMTPRIKLTSVPYAFQANTARQLEVQDNGFDGNLNFDTLTDHRSILLPDASGTLILDSTLGATAFLQDGNSFGQAAVLGTNDTFDLQFETDGVSRMTIDATGNVGIGAGTPESKLHVEGAAAANSYILTVQNTTVGGELIVGQNHLGNNVFQANVDGSGNGALRVNNFDGSNAILLYAGGDSYIDTGGRLGIGTKTPGQKLEVSGTGLVQAVRFSNTTANGVIDLGLDVKGSMYGFGVYNNAGTQILQLNSDGGMALGTYANSTTEGPANGLIVSGSVGIGTDAPGAPLHVKGNVTGDFQSWLENTATGSSVAAFKAINDLGSGGSFGIGSSTHATQSWANRTFVATSTDGNGISLMARNATSGDIRLYTGGSGSSNERLRIDVAGNVGIGTTNANEKLTVNGVIALGETTAPTATANLGKVYVKSSNSKLYYMDDSGTEYDLTAGGSSPTLQSVYDEGNSIITGDNRDILFTLADTATDSDFVIDMQGTGNEFSIRDNGTPVLTLQDGGYANFQNSVDSTAAFLIRDAAGTSLFQVDTTNKRVYIGSPTADSTGTLLVFDNKNTTGDPAGVDGAMYYNSALGKFRCYEAGGWGDCGTLPSTGFFTDNTGVTLSDSNTDLWQLTTYPNLDVENINNTVLISAVIYGSGAANDDEYNVFTIHRAIGSDPDCNSTQVGSGFVAYTTNSAAPLGASATFIDNPSTLNNVRYTVCSSTDAYSSNSVDNDIFQISITLQENGN